jgi:hypothetical protein
MRSTVDAPRSPPSRCAGPQPVIFGFGRRDTPEVIDVVGLQSLATQRCEAGLDSPILD